MVDCYITQSAKAQVLLSSVSLSDDVVSSIIMVLCECSKQSIYSEPNDNARNRTLNLIGKPITIVHFNRDEK